MSPTASAAVRHLAPMRKLSGKIRRQRAIVDLLRKERVSSQEDLARRLAARGIRVTQSTLSRDLKELRVARQTTPEGVRYVASGGDRQLPALQADSGRLLRVTAEEVTRVDANESCVVLRTLAGRASGVAAFLDSWAHEELLGTIAGDDTVVLVPRSVRRTRRLRRAVAELFGIP